MEGNLLRRLGASTLQRSIVNQQTPLGERRTIHEKIVQKTKGWFYALNKINQKVIMICLYKQKVVVWLKFANEM